MATGTAGLRIGLSTLVAVFAACGLASDGKRDQSDVQTDPNGDVTIVGMGSISDRVLDDEAPDDEAPDDEAQTAPVSGAEGGSGAGEAPVSGGEEASSLPESVNAICPPLGTDAYGCLPGPTWARELQTGTCCKYASYPGRCTPPGWPLFASEEECQTSCRCAEVVPAFPEQPETAELTTERISLACGCAGVFSCPENLEAAIARLCEPTGAGVIRQQRCGNVQLSAGGPYVGSSFVFDAASGALIGAAYSSDTPSQPCGSFMTIAGRDFNSCTEPASSCVLCGEPFLGDDLERCQ